MRTRITTVLLVAALLASASNLFAQKDKQRDLFDLAAVELQRKAAEQQLRATYEAQLAAFADAQATQQLFIAMNKAGTLSPEPAQLVQHRHIQRELELDKDQIKEIASIEKNYKQRIQDTIKRRSENRNINPKQWNDSIMQIYRERNSAIGAVLLPHQEKRVKQISTQLAIKKSGDFNALTAPLIATELGIDAEQRKRIHRKSSELQRKLEDEIVKLKAKLKDELLQELSPAQRKKFKEMVGEKFRPKKK